MRWDHRERCSFQVSLSNPDSKTLDLVWYRLVHRMDADRCELVDSRGSGDLVSLARSSGFIEVTGEQPGTGTVEVLFLVAVYGHHVSDSGGPPHRAERFFRSGRVRGGQNAPVASLKEMVDDKVSGALAAQQVHDRMDEYLSVCQVGITFASIGLGFVAEAARWWNSYEPVIGWTGLFPEHSTLNGSPNMESHGQSATYWSVTFIS